MSLLFTTALHKVHSQILLLYQDHYLRWKRSSASLSSIEELHIILKSLQEEQSDLEYKSEREKAEIASRLAEGLLRALRALALTEASDLHTSLHFWTQRSELPFLDFLEAGPFVWFSKRGYDRRDTLSKISQIQAVLARRISVIGELQQHLLRAGWQGGVAQWGMLGIGNEWAFAGSSIHLNMNIGAKSSKKQNKITRQHSVEIFKHSSTVGNAVSDSTHIGVHNTRGGAIVTNSGALTAWSVDAVRVVRDQLYRAGDRTDLMLPYSSHWPQEKAHFEGMIDELPVKHVCDMLPPWATLDRVENNTGLDVHQSEFGLNKNNCHGVTISDLPLMIDEVSKLLEMMQRQMEEQRNRRLEKLKPPMPFRRNWYYFALCTPVAGYTIYKLMKDRWGVTLLNQAMTKLSSFYAEHVSEPLTDIFNELFTSKPRIAITDQAAGAEIEQSLKNMLKSWLDETYPDKSEKWRAGRAEKMDMSLIEKKKEESVLNALKSTFTGEIVRMGLIEVQFIKKELMNAMKGLDEVMDSNELNFRLAATAPALMLMYAAREAVHWLFYAFFKVRQSREDTYSSFCAALLEIERLLVMREDIASPPSLKGGLKYRIESQRTRDYSFDVTEGDFFDESNKQNVLSSDDLGMLMLLVHECRSILSQNRRRFTDHDRRNISEDLSELCGERGCVSVKQQLFVISRMHRTYAFMHKTNRQFLTLRAN